MTYHGKYRQSKEKFPIMDVIAVAVAVDRAQGLVKAGEGRPNLKTGIPLYDNRTVALHTLRAMSQYRDLHEGTSPIILPTDTDRQQAQEIYEHFAEIIVMGKLSDSLTITTRDGRKNDFNLILSEIFAAKVADSSKELAMIVSLPNSRRVSEKREIMSEFYAANPANGYVGTLKARVKLSGRVMDVKRIPRCRTGRNQVIHLATVLTTENRIVSFMMNDKLADIAYKIDGTDITFVGKVKEQEINIHTNCQYTLLNSIKFDNPDN
jgi:hypothetical protein